MIRVGVIGYGYWGPNIVRNFYAVNGFCVQAVCDKSAESLQRVKRAYPGLHVTQDAKEVLESPAIDAVAVITPVWTHYQLAKAALENGKHVFVEKPFTSNVAQGEKLIDIAIQENLRVMVDHTFLFTGAVRKIKELLNEKALGNLYYYDSTRVNLGLFQHDVDVIWDLAVHDLSILDFLLPQFPVAVSATGIGHVKGAAENVAYVTAFYDSALIAHLNVNWLSPVKVRRTLLGGSQQMVVYDDMESSEKVKVYDKGITIKNGPE